VTDLDDIVASTRNRWTEQCRTCDRYTSLEDGAAFQNRPIPCISLVCHEFLPNSFQAVKNAARMTLFTSRQID
jgi:hypothetical protein